MYTIIYFSATGNTKYLALQLKESLKISDVDFHQLDKVSINNVNKGEHLILMYPIHGFNPPRTVTRFIKGFPKGLFEKVSLLSVGCNEIWVNDAVSKPLRKELEKKGYNIVVDEILAMPLTLVMDFPEENKKKVIEKALEDLSGIVIKIKDSVVSNRKVRFKSKVIHTVGKLESPAARMFGLELHAKKNCISCGICWENCPEGNIKRNKKDKPKFGFKCSMCLRCVYECPEQSITPYVSKFITIKGGYKLFEEEK